jgi:peptidoglycan/xylan/chitin deacetylase (PgdA/CDA1 family)
MERELVGYGEHPPDPRWPGGARLALSFVLNYEEGGERTPLEGDAEAEAFLHEVVGAPATVGRRNLNVESMFDFGSRAGFWRVHRIFRKYGLPLTVYGVGQALERNPAAARAMVEAGWEVASHGWRWIDYLEMSEDEERAHIRRAIEAIERVARETLTDIDGIVAALREGEAAATAPLPGTEAITALVDRHRDAGLDFELVVRGTPGRAIPRPVDHAAYRIAQEALTNAARHGRGSAEIVVTLSTERLELTVTNPLAPGRRAEGGGHGLVGMRERATLLGGAFGARAENGRFRVRAVLPYDRAGHEGR